MSWFIFIFLLSLRKYGSPSKVLHFEWWRSLNFSQGHITCLSLPCTNHRHMPTADTEAHSNPVVDPFTGNLEVQGHVCLLLLTQMQWVLWDGTQCEIPKNREAVLHNPHPLDSTASLHWTSFYNMELRGCRWEWNTAVFAGMYISLLLKGSHQVHNVTPSQYQLDPSCYSLL